MATKTPTERAVDEMGARFARLRDLSRETGKLINRVKIQKLRDEALESREMALECAVKMDWSGHDIFMRDANTSEEEANRLEFDNSIADV